MYRLAFSAEKGKTRRTRTKKTVEIAEEEEVPSLKAALEGLKVEAVVRVERNKELLSKRMVAIRSEIKSLRRSPYTKGRSIYSQNEAPALVDIRG
jgi:hypothetical protein